MGWEFGLVKVSFGNDFAAYGISAPFLRTLRR